VYTDIQDGQGAPLLMVQSLNAHGMNIFHTPTSVNTDLIRQQSKITSLASPILPNLQTATSAASFFSNAIGIQPSNALLESQNPRQISEQISTTGKLESAPAYQNPLDRTSSIIPMKQTEPLLSNVAEKLDEVIQPNVSSAQTTAIETIDNITSKAVAHVTDLLVPTIAPKVAVNLTSTTKVIDKATEQMDLVVQKVDKCGNDFNKAVDSMSKTIEDLEKTTIQNATQILKRAGVYDDELMHSFLSSKTLQACQQVVYNLVPKPVLDLCQKALKGGQAMWKGVESAKQFVNTTATQFSKIAPESIQNDLVKDDIVNSLQQILSCIDVAVNALDEITNIFPPVKAAWFIVSSVYKVLQFATSLSLSDTCHSFLVL
jgi:hypothetical protein